MMRIAAIDYGVDTGIAIAELAYNRRIIFLKYYVVCTIYNNIPDVLSLITASRSSSVVLEKCPALATSNSRDIFEELYRNLSALGFKNGKGILEPGCLLTISPGTWKPFVKKQMIDFSSWNPESRHEKDAMGLLWYATKISEPYIREVFYDR